MHQLRCAQRLPRAFLLARELHTHWRADGTRQQGRIGRHVVGTVAAIATGGFHAHDVDVDIWQAHQARQVGAQHMRVLRSGPDQQPCTGVRIGLPPVGQRARRADGRVHLVRPQVGARHGQRCMGHRGIDIAFIDQQAPGGWIAAQCAFEVVQVG